MTDRSRGRPVARGSANTLDVQGVPAELQPARAIRRALAAVRLKALDVGYVCVVAPEDMDAAFVEHVIRRAFGDHVNHIETDVRRATGTPAGNGGVNEAERACVDWLAAGRASGAVAVDLGFGGRTRALAVRVVG